MISRRTAVKYIGSSVIGAVAAPHVKLLAQPLSASDLRQSRIQVIDMSVNTTKYLAGLKNGWD
jgi:hypothetical protein